MPLWPQNTPAPLITPVKRGQSRITTLTESSYPTEKPGTAYHHGVPMIGGSTGGFIGLVVGLGVLAIITSVAAFVLIRRRRRAQGKGGDMLGGFPKPGIGIFGRMKSKGWMQTHSYTDHDDIHLRPKGGGHSNSYNEPIGGAPPNAERVYDDPFNAESLDNLQRETSARIDHGPEYVPVSTVGDPDLHHHPSTSPTSLTGGTKFKEAI